MGGVVFKGTDKHNLILFYGIRFSGNIKGALSFLYKYNFILGVMVSCKRSIMIAFIIIGMSEIF